MSYLAHAVALSWRDLQEPSEIRSYLYLCERDYYRILGLWAPSLRTAYNLDDLIPRFLAFAYENRIPLGWRSQIDCLNWLVSSGQLSLGDVGVSIARELIAISASQWAYTDRSENISIIVGAPRAFMTAVAAEKPRALDRERRLGSCKPEQLTDLRKNRCAWHMFDHPIFPEI